MPATCRQRSNARSKPGSDCFHEVRRSRIESSEGLSRRLSLRIAGGPIVERLSRVASQAYPDFQFAIFNSQWSPQSAAVLFVGIRHCTMPRWSDGLAREHMSVFVWIFHRLSGVLLIVLLSLQLVTGMLQASPSQGEWAKTSSNCTGTAYCFA